MNLNAKTLHVEINESSKKIKEAYLQIFSYFTYKLPWPTKLDIEKCYVTVRLLTVQIYILSNKHIRNTNGNIRN